MFRQVAGGATVGDDDRLIHGALSLKADRVASGVFACFRITIFETRKINNFPALRILAACFKLEPIDQLASIPFHGRARSLFKFGRHFEQTAKMSNGKHAQIVRFRDINHEIDHVGLLFIDGRQADDGFRLFDLIQ